MHVPAPEHVAGRTVIRRPNSPVTPNKGDLSLRTARLKNAVLEWSVLEAVLVDIIDRHEAAFPNRGRNETIVFATGRPGKLVSASGLIDGDQPPQGLSAGQLESAIEAAKNAAWTQHERDFVESFRPKDERIVVRDERRLDPWRPVRVARTEAAIRAHAPGFSKDKQVAIVSVYLGGGIHLTYETYVLGRQDGRWVVLAREITMNP